MALPVASKSWQVVPNVVVPGATGDAAQSLARVFVALVTQLLALDGGAVVRASTEGTTADGTNRWTNAATLDWPEDPGDGAAWIRLGLPGVGPTFEVLIALMTPASSQALGVWASWGGFTGGTRTARPTATDEVQLCGTGGAGGTGFGGGTGAIDTDRVLHVWFATDGSALRVRVYQGGTLDHVLDVERPRVALAEWDMPYIARAMAGDAGSVDRATYAGLTPLDAFKGAITFNGDVRQLTFGLTGEAADGQLVAQRLPSGNKVTGKYPSDPCGIFSDSSYFLDGTQSLAGRYGELADLWWGAHIATGSTYPGDASRTLIQVGDQIHPWNGGASFLTSAP